MVRFSVLKNTLKNRTEPNLTIPTRAGTLRTNAKDSAVKAVPAGYDLNGSDRKKIAGHVEEWLEDDQYIFPLRDGVSNFFIWLHAV